MDHIESHLSATIKYAQELVIFSQFNLKQRGIIGYLDKLKRGCVVEATIIFNWQHKRDLTLKRHFQKQIIVV